VSKVFISYRREDAAGYAQAIYGQLEHHLPRDQIFMDVDTVEPGIDFVSRIVQGVSESDVLIALIGKRWKGERENAAPRIHDPEDFVHLEIVAALSRDIRVIPVLVDGASMPRLEELPLSLQPLVRRHALELSNTRFRFDLERVSQAVQRALVPPSIPKPISWRRRSWIYASLSIFLITLAIVAGLWIRDSLDQEQGKREVRIADLLKKARTAESNGRLTSPAKDNAIDYFLEVLQLNPENFDARAGVRRIAERKVTSAEKLPAQDVEPKKPRRRSGFSLQDILFVLREGVESRRIVGLVRERGINFDVTSEAQDQLKRAAQMPS
jgi:TIR domain